MTENNINIDLKQTEEVLCDKCGHNTFVQAFYIRKVSAVIAGQESLLPISVFECSQCGHVNKIFEPK